MPQHNYMIYLLLVTQYIILILADDVYKSPKTSTLHVFYYLLWVCKKKFYLIDVLMFHIGCYILHIVSITVNGLY